MVLAQLVEWSVPALEVRGSNPVIGKFLCRTFVYCQLYHIGYDENKEKETGNVRFLKKTENDVW